MGNPDGPTPRHIVDKLVEVAQREDTHGYSVSKGIPRLRRAICNWYKRRYDVDIDPDSEAIVTIGSKEGLAHLMLATLDRGDTVLVPNPSYPIHIYGAVIAGADIRSVRMTPGVDFFAELERAIRELIPEAEDDDPRLPVATRPRSASSWTSSRRSSRSPSSTTSSWCTTSPTPTSRSTAGRRPRSCRCPARNDVAVEFFTMSKSYNMAGWRIGFMVGNAELVNALARIKSYHDYGTFTPLQVAAIAALEGPQECVEEIRAKYQKRRDVMVKGLHEVGWMVENPKASMYVWAQIPEQYAQMGSHRVRQEAAARGEGRGLARHRLRRLRRRPRALRADREREPHCARRCAASRRCSARTAC